MEKGTIHISHDELNSKSIVAKIGEMPYGEKVSIGILDGNSVEIKIGKDVGKDVLIIANFRTEGILTAISKLPEGKKVSIGILNKNSFEIKFDGNDGKMKDNEYKYGI